MVAAIGVSAVAVPARGPLAAAATRARWLRAARAVVATALVAPATTAVVAGAALVATLVATGVVDAASLQRWASTNVVNLYSHPISAMVVSAFVLTGASVAGIAVAAAVCGLFERRVGARRLLLVAAAGQVIPSLITEGAVRLAIHAGGESRAAAVRFDVGLSYVTFSVAAALTRFVPRRWRGAAVAAGLAITAIQFAATHDMTASGHALAYGVGLLSWPLLTRRGEPAIASHRVRRWALCSLAALAVIGLLAVYLPPASFGLHPAQAKTVTGSSWQGTVP